MNLNVIKAYLMKEITEIVRSRLIIAIYLLPTMIILLFGYGIRMEVTHTRTAIIDYDKSKLSNDLISKFEHSKYFDVKFYDIEENKALNLMKQAKLDALIIIPEDFEKRVLKVQKTEIGIYIDASFPMRGTTIESYIQGILLDASTEYLKDYPKKYLISVNQRILFNQSMRDENAIVPGLLGIILFVAPAILSALLIVKEKETGTIFNFYSSPVNKIEFLIAKLTPVFLLHSINIFILFLWAIYVFEVPFRGNFFIYWITSEIYVLISLSIGLLVSIITKTQIVAIIMTVVITVLPGFLYSGIIMPISSLRNEAYVEAHLFPVMYYNHIIYDTFLIGQGFSSEKNILYFFILILYSLLLLVIGVRFMKKEL